MKVSKWGPAVREILRAADVKAAHVAERLQMNRAMLHQYLSGRCRPGAEIVRKIDRHVEQLISRRSGIAVFLDCTAMQDGLISSDIGLLAKAMDRTMKGLADRGLLVSDWRERLSAHIADLDDKGANALRRATESIILASHQPIVDDITGKTPVTTTSWQPVRAALLRHGLGELVSKPSAFQVELDAFATSVREVLLHPPATSYDRLGDEAELIGAAMRLLHSTFARPPRKFTDEDLIHIAKSMGVKA